MRTIFAITIALAAIACTTDQVPPSEGQPELEKTPVVFPTATPTATPVPTPKSTPTKEPFGQRFVRDRVAKLISQVALEYDCRVDPVDIDVSDIVAPSLWDVFLLWASEWLLTDADKRGALKTVILENDMSPREFVERLPQCR